MSHELKKVKGGWLWVSPFTGQLWGVFKRKRNALKKMKEFAASF
jgi:hypothetical protein